jgi:SAM-dependent methyltransferase
MIQFIPDLSIRRREEEWMDAPGISPAEIRRSLSFIRRVNRLLRYTRATVGHLDRFSRTWRAGESITILDVATGSGDIPRAIAEWSKRRKFDVRITGLDRHAQTAGIARDLSQSHPQIRIVRGDAMSLPFADGSFDYVHTSMFLHHLDDDQVVRVLMEMNRVARRGIIAADLLRHRRAYFWISLFTVFSHPIIKHDARVSVAQAFVKDDVLSLRHRAGIGYAGYFTHFGHRFVLAGEKPG